MAIDSDSKIPTVGFFPNTFPRDPVSINNFYEHVLIGQIIEPLVENTPSGEIAPCIASDWKILNDGKTIEFGIRKGMLFSNGKSVTSEDVKYTLMRHKNGDSQSKSYLEKIETIDTPAADKLVIHLSSPYVAIFKVLSRDHLGIVPAGWTFDPKSDRPFVGTGPYEVVRIKGDWLLTRNKYYRSPEQILTERWKPIFYDIKNPAFNKQPNPDFIPYALSDVANAVVSLKSKAGESVYKAQPINHFMQLSGWWYPHGNSYSNVEHRERSMSAVHSLLQRRRVKLDLRQATGVIPEGIAGYVPSTPQPKMKKKASEKTILTVRVAVVERELAAITDAADIKAVENEFGVRFVFTPVGLTEFSSLRASKPDVVVFVYAGGFHDPEGFLVVITAVLQSNLQTLFGSLYESYLAASRETDWDKRTRLYQELNRKLTEAGMIAPGWKSTVLSLTKKNITQVSPAFSYTIKLINYSSK